MVKLYPKEFDKLKGTGLTISLISNILILVKAFVVKYRQLEFKLEL